MSRFWKLSKDSLNPIKATKKSLSATKKVFKKVWKSKIGRVILIAIAIYLGGWALGAWAGPAGLLGGGGAAAAGTGGVTGVGALGAQTSLVTAGGAAGGAAAGGVAAGIAAPAIAPTATYTVGGVAGTATSSGVAGTVGALVPAAAPVGTAPPAIAPEVTANVGGIPQSLSASPAGGVPVVESAGTAVNAGGIVNTIRGLGGVLKDNQLLAAVGLQGFAGAFGADAEQEALDEERRRRERNLLVGNVDLGVRPSGRPLRRLSTGENVFDNGIIRNRTGTG